MGYFERNFAEICDTCYMICLSLIRDKGLAPFLPILTTAIEIIHGHEFGSGTYVAFVSHEHARDSTKLIHNKIIYFSRLISYRFLWSSCIMCLFFQLPIIKTLVRRGTIVFRSYNKFILQYNKKVFSYQFMNLFIHEYCS